MAKAVVDAILDGGTVAAETTTGPDGRFELELTPASYTLRAVVNSTTIADARVEADAAAMASVELKSGRFISSTSGGAVKGIPSLTPSSGQIVRVFYATDREPNPVRSAIGWGYGKERSKSGELSYGSCLVSIPRDHKLGTLESPSLWSFDLTPTAGKYVVVTRVTKETEPEFYHDVSSKLQASGSRRALVFVHGFNVTFTDAARRTAQIAYDLGFDGAPILYSWPSQGSVDGYPADEESVQWTVTHLRSFLENVARESGATTIQLVAHSMGNRALLNAISQLSTRANRPRFREVILAAPDIDAGVFSQLVAAVRSSSDRITLYASSGDKALVVSRKFHSFSRAGESGDNLTIVRGVDTVDASKVDTSLLGHSYYGDNRVVLHDMFDLIRYDLPPEHRFGLEKQQKAIGSYWTFRE